MIPISQPFIPKSAYAYLKECLKSGWVSSAGSFVERFEDNFATYIGTKYAVATNSGTSALHLSLAALNISKGEEVIVPTYTMIASVLPILYLGATPVFVDVEEITGNIDATKIEKVITKETKAIMVVHMFGHPVNMDPFIRLAKKYNLAIVEDAAEAHGAEYLSQKTKKWHKVGSLGTIGCFSFYGNKVITTGEGGMAVTNNKALADRMRSLRNLARTPGKHFLHTEVAFAYRMSNLQAALGVAELEEIDTLIQKKRGIAQTYRHLLEAEKGIILPTEMPYAKSIFWQYGIRVTKNGYDYAKAQKALAKKGIETRSFFVPMHLQPALLFLPEVKGLHFPIAEKLAQQGLCIPSGVALTQKDIQYVAKAVKDVLHG